MGEVVCSRARTLRHRHAATYLAWVKQVRTKEGLPHPTLSQASGLSACTAACQNEGGGVLWVRHACVAQAC
jgi:hypothetical protein